jgi:hypothetical protein
MKTNKTITQAKNVIYKRIENLEKKIENAKERWPEDMYGGRWLEKASSYQDEQDFLGRYLAMLEQVERGIDVEDRKARTIFTERKLMRDAVSALRTYGETRLAAMIEREVNYLDESRS